jgi:hypothetical protein
MTAAGDESPVLHAFVTARRQAHLFYQLKLVEHFEDLILPA